MRIWRGWTLPENAGAYHALLLNEIFPGIEGRRTPGYRGISLSKRPVGREIEFITIMWFDDWADVEAFAGKDYEAAVVPEKARAILARFEERSAHFEVLVPPPVLR